MSDLLSNNDVKLDDIIHDNDIKINIDSINVNVATKGKTNGVDKEINDDEKSEKDDKKNGGEKNGGEKNDEKSGEKNDEKSGEKRGNQKRGNQKRAGDDEKKANENGDNQNTDTENTDDEITDGESIDTENTDGESTDDDGENIFQNTDDENGDGENIFQNTDDENGDSENNDPENTDDENGENGDSENDYPENTDDDNEKKIYKTLNDNFNSEDDNLSMFSLEELEERNKSLPPTNDLQSLDINTINELKNTLPPEILNNLDLIVRTMSKEFYNDLENYYLKSIDKEEQPSIKQIINSLSQYPSNKEIDNDYGDSKEDPLYRLLSFNILDPLIKGITLSKNNKNIEFIYLNIVKFLKDNNLLSTEQYKQWLRMFLIIHDHVKQNDFFDSEIYYQNLLNIVIEDKDFLFFPTSSSPFDTLYLLQAKIINKDDITSSSSNNDSNTNNINSIIRNSKNLSTKNLSTVDLNTDLLLSELIYSDFSRLYYIVNQLSNSRLTLKKNLPIELPNTDSGNSLMKRAKIQLKKLLVKDDIIQYVVKNNRDGNEKGILVKQSLHKIIDSDIVKNTSNNLFVVDVENDTGHEIDYEKVLFSKLPQYLFLYCKLDDDNSRIYAFKKINHFSNESEKLFVDMVTREKEEDGENLILRDNLSKNNIVKIIANNLKSKKYSEYVIYKSESNINSMILVILQKLFKKMLKNKGKRNETNSILLKGNESRGKVGIKDIRVFNNKNDPLSFVIIKFE